MPANILPHLTNTKSGGERGSRQLERLSKRQERARVVAEMITEERPHQRGCAQTWLWRRFSRWSDRVSEVRMTDTFVWTWIGYFCILLTFDSKSTHILFRSVMRMPGHRFTSSDSKSSDSFTGCSSHTNRCVCVLQLTKYRNYRHIFRQILGKIVM